MSLTLLALTAFDPETSSEGTLDPLGLYLIADQLATKGEQGLNITNPEVRCTFRNLEADFSGPKAESYMYVAMQRYLPVIDEVIDLSR